jgi:hypothetical protein
VRAALTDAIRKAGCQASIARAEALAANLAPIIAELQAAGARSLRAIAARLNDRGIETSRGVGKWGAGNVAGAVNVRKMLNYKKFNWTFGRRRYVKRELVKSNFYNSLDNLPHSNK